jgi:hypothetical protein
MRIQKVLKFLSELKMALCDWCELQPDNPNASATGCVEYFITSAGTSTTTAVTTINYKLTVHRLLYGEELSCLLLR